MRHRRGWGFRGALAAAVSGTIALGGAAQAQTAAATPAPGAGLRQQLSDLAANPQSVNELVATGRAALAMGDGQAALGFFTRAQELDGRNARVKAGLAVANVRTGRPETALSLFAEAVALGAPEVELRADRGLAYDMIGQTARAQQDYLAALRHRDDAEVRRRLALSLAISGQREAALRLIEPQIASGDRAGQRARIMVLALTGDTRGASAAAGSSLTPQQAGALTPFLTRLAALSPADMAAAANLGRVPSGSAIRQAPARAEADPAALAFAGGGTTALPARLPVALAEATPRRRPGGVTSNAAARDAGRPRGNWTNAAATNAARPPATTAARSTATTEVSSASVPVALVLPHPHEPLRISSASLEAAGLAGTGGPGPRVPAARVAEAASAQPVQLASAQPVASGPAYQPEPDPAPAEAEGPADGAAANLAVWNSAVPAASTRTETRPTPASTAPVQAAARREAVAATPSPTPARASFSDVAAAVSALPAETPAAAPRRNTPATRTTTRDRAATPRTTTQAPMASVTSRTGTASTARTGSTANTRAANPRQAHPERIWVQLGVSNNRAGFGYEMTRMRRLAPELARQTPHTAPVGNSHRLLVGPFPNDAAARALINTLRSKDIQSLAWTSGAGTEVARLPTGR